MAQAQQWPILRCRATGVVAGAFSARRWVPDRHATIIAVRCTFAADSLVTVVAVKHLTAHLRGP
jgi:hypothetical protein